MKFTQKRQKKNKSTYTLTCRCDCLYQNFFFAHMHLVWSEALKHFCFRVSVLSENPPQLFGEVSGLKLEPLQKHHSGAERGSQIQSIHTSTINRFGGSKQCQLNSILWKHFAGKACQKKQTTRRKHSVSKLSCFNFARFLSSFWGQGFNWATFCGGNFLLHFFASSLLPNKNKPSVFLYVNYHVVLCIFFCFMYFLQQALKRRKYKWEMGSAPCAVTASLNWLIPTQTTRALNSLTNSPPPFTFSTRWFFYHSHVF